MANHLLNLRCLVDGGVTSRTFNVEVDRSKDIGQLKKIIKTEKTPEFDNIAADSLTLWHVSVAVAEDDEDIIFLDNLNEKKKCYPIMSLSKLFIEEPPEGLIHFTIQRPTPEQVNSAMQLELSTLRKQLLDISDLSISLGVIVKPDEEVVFTWSTMINEATLDNLKARITSLLPHYTPETLNVLVFNE